MTDRKEWVPDSEAKKCSGCQKAFGLVVRRHHCRACGEVFCAKCSGGKTVLENGPGRAQRVCNACLEKQLKKDNQRFESEVIKKKETDERKKADDEYVTHIYDKEGLVKEIIHYLQGGSEADVIVDGERRASKLWLHAGPDSLYRQCKDQQPDSITLDKLQSIKMGNGPAFKGAPIAKQEYNYCITIEFKVPSKQGLKSLPVICKELVEFEAWVLGLSHIIRTTPVWDTPLKLERSYMKSLPLAESEVLSKHNIPGDVYKKTREALVDRQTEVKHHLWVHDDDRQRAYVALGKKIKPFVDKHGAVYATKGEVRHICGLDIFRSCTLWEMFAKQHLIFDPNYRPSVGHGSEERKKKEQRIDPADGKAYSRSEFISHYGSTSEWEKALPVEEGKEATDATAAAAKSGDNDKTERGVGEKKEQEAKEEKGDEKKEEDKEKEERLRAEKAEREALKRHAKEDGKEENEGQAEDEEQEKERLRAEKAKAKEEKARAKAEAKAAAVREETEVAEEDEGTKAAQKAERKRLRRIYFAVIGAAVAVATQSAYEAKRAARKARRREAAALQAEAEAEGEAAS